MRPFQEICDAAVAMTDAGWAALGLDDKCPNKAMSVDDRRDIACASMIASAAICAATDLPEETALDLYGMALRDAYRRCAGIKHREEEEVV